jgi:hypothetical protein
VECDEFTQTQAFVELPHQNQAAVGGDPRSSEVDFQRSFEAELKRLILLLTHWLWTSGASSSRSNSHKQRRPKQSQSNQRIFKSETRDHYHIQSAQPPAARPYAQKALVSHQLEVIRAGGAEPVPACRTSAATTVKSDCFH